MYCKLLFSPLFLCLAASALAQNLPWHPPEPPSLSADDSDWDTWYKAWIEHQAEVNGYDVAPGRQYMLESDWSVFEDFSPDRADHHESKVKIQLRAFQEDTGMPNPYRSYGNARGQSLYWGARNVTKGCQGTCIWNFKWVGSVGKSPPMGCVQRLKGRLMGLAYARARNANCGTLMAIPAHWADSFGRQLECLLGVAGETDGQQVATSVGFSFWNVTVTLNNGQSFATAKCKDHTPLLDRMRFGTPRAPWRVWVKHRTALKSQVTGSNDSGLGSFKGWGVTESRGEVTMNFSGVFTEVGGAK